MDLGNKDESLAPSPAPAAASPEKPAHSSVIFPTVTLDDKSAGTFTKQNDIEPGKEYAGTIHFKASPGADGAGLSIDILDIGDVAEESAEGGESGKPPGAPSIPGDGDDAEKILGVKLPKKTPFREPVKASSNFLD